MRYIEQRIEAIEKENALLKKAVEELNKKIGEAGPHPDLPMTMKQAAEYCGENYHTFRRRHIEGLVGSCNTIGGRPVFKRADLDAYLNGITNPKEKANGHLKTLTNP